MDPVVNLRVSRNAGNFSRVWEYFNFSRRILLRGLSELRSSERKTIISFVILTEFMLYNRDVVEAEAEFLSRPMFYIVGRDSSVGIATRYGLDGPEIESRWGRGFPHLSIPALGPTEPPVQWVPGLCRGKERPGPDADPSPLLVPYSIKSRAIPLLPLWAVRPVQNLSACTRVHYNLILWFRSIIILKRF